MSFIEIALNEWDVTKVRIGKAKQDPTAKPTVLYDGKIPIMKLCSGDPRNNYVVFSFNGLQKSMEFDEETKKPTDIWDGGWTISFCICSKVSEATPMQKKLMDIFDDIAKKVKTAFKKDPEPTFLNYTYITKKDPDTGVEEIVGIDPNKGAYIKTKVAYEAPPDAPKIKDKKNKEVPAFDYRKPKAKFYDITRDVKKIKVENPDKECMVGMDAIPKFMISLWQNKPTDPIYITKRLFECYYQPKEIGGANQDDDLIRMLRENLDFSKFDNDPQ